MNNWFTRYLVGMAMWIMPVLSYVAWGKFAEQKDFWFLFLALVAAIAFWVSVDIHKAMAKRS